MIYGVAAVHQARIDDAAPVAEHFGVGPRAIPEAVTATDYLLETCDFWRLAGISSSPAFREDAGAAERRYPCRRGLGVVADRDHSGQEELLGGHLRTHRCFLRVQSSKSFQ